MSLDIQSVSRRATTDPVLNGWQEQIRAAAAEGRTLRITGGGSKSFYGRPMAGEKLDTTHYCGIVAYEPTELVITARCGTPLAEIESALAERGQMLAFEPPRFAGAPSSDNEVRADTSASPQVIAPAPRHEAALPGTASGAKSQATIGGVVAAGLSGPRRMAAGAVRDFVLGVRLLDGQGELLCFGGQVMKNVAGYDVSRLLAGSLGGLGVLAEVSLKVTPRPRQELGLRFELNEREALAQLHRWAGQPLPISASTWYDNVLYLRLAGAEAAVTAAHQKLGGEPMTPEHAEAFWAGLRDQTHRFFTDPPADTALFRLALPDTAPVLGLAAPQLIEWGGAQRWCRTGLGEAQKISANATSHGGHATVFRPPPGVAVDHVFTPLPAALWRIHRQLKHVFDPAGIFNRGRMYRDL